MNFKEDIITNYIDQDGLVTIDKNPTKWSTGNGLLFTGIFLVLLHMLDDLDEDTECNFVKAIRACEVEPGLFDRNPGRTDSEAHDDYIGVAAASYFCVMGFAHDIWLYGEKHFYCWNNQDPGKFSLSHFDARFIGLMPFYRIAAGQKLWFARKWELAFAINENAKDTTASDKILMWLETRVAKDRGLCLKEISNWDAALIKQFGSLEGLFAQYFGKDHPFSTCGVNV